MHIEIDTVSFYIRNFGDTNAKADFYVEVELANDEEDNYFIEISEVNEEGKTNTVVAHFYMDSCGNTSDNVDYSHPLVREVLEILYHEGTGIIKPF